jgi:hypothetical protein
MGRKDKFDAETVDQALHLGSLHACRLQLHDGRLDRLADGLAAVLAEHARDPPAPQQDDSEVLLRKVHQLKVEREGHRLVERRLGIKIRHRICQQALRAGVVGAPRLCQAPEEFDRVECAAPLDACDDLAKRHAEGPDLRPQRRHVAHGFGHSYGAFLWHGGQHDEERRGG